MFSFGQLGLPGGAQSVDPALVITGTLTGLEAGTSPTLTLSVANNPATNPYDSFAEVADADGIASLSTATITITTTNKVGSHSLTYKAVSSGGRPDITRIFTVTVVDTTAPALSLPTDTKTGSTTADIGATTNEGSSPSGSNGTLYVVASTSSTAPTAAQIIAGQMHTGAAAAASGSVAVSSTGAKTVGVTGLTASTAYFGHSVQKDSQNNISNVVSGDGFTTDGAGASLIDRTAGTNIGNMTDGGGLAASFDGVTNQVSGSATVSIPNSHTCYVGKTLAVASAIDHAVVYGSNDTGYAANGDGVITLKLYGKQGAAPSGATDGTLLGTVGPFAQLTDEHVGRTVTSSDTTTVFDHAWINRDSDGIGVVAEVELWKP